MISMKSLTLLLVLLLVTRRFSCANRYQDGNLARGVKVVSTEEESLDDKLALRLGGRKSMVDHFKRPKTVETKGSLSLSGTRAPENPNDLAPKSNLEGKDCSTIANPPEAIYAIQTLHKDRILLSDEYGEDASDVYPYDYNASNPARSHTPKNNR